MGWWQVGADTLAESRFVISPLAETTAGLIALARGTTPHPGGRSWLDAHLAPFRARVSADPVTAELVRVGVGPRWITALFTSPPGGLGPALSPGSPASAQAVFAGEVAAIRSMPADAALAELAVDVDGPVSAVLCRRDLPDRAANLLEWVWTRAVLPYWRRRRRVLEADIVARTAKLGQGGWVAALGDMRPGMRWLGEGRLRINAYDYPPRSIVGAEQFFVPVTWERGWVSWDVPELRRYAVMYPCSGVLAGVSDGVLAHHALGALLGPGRALILVLLDAPKSTTQLVALTGQPLGSMGRHLKILLDAGLLERRRAGRSVLYYRTAVAESLVAAQPDPRASVTRRAPR